MSRRARRSGGAARVGAVCLVGAALVLGAARVPLSTMDAGGRAPAATPGSAQPVAGARLVCPGPETIGVQGAAADRPPGPAYVSAAAPPRALTGVPAVPGTLTGTATPGDRLFSTAGTPTGSSAVGGSLTAAAAVTVRGERSAAPGLVAEQLTMVDSGDLRGLAGTACAAPAADIWLVGGGGEEGRRGRIVLANPAPNPVEVSLQVLAVDGPVATRAGRDVAVAANSRVVVLLDALAPGVEAPVVHVTATGGTVAAVLHDARLAGTTPRGTDDVAPAAPPARRVLVPGVAIDGHAVLRLAAPGGSEAVAQVRLVGPGGPVDVPGGGVVRVPAGSTQDLDLTGVPAGSYGIEVRADVPVLAGAMVEREKDTGGPADIAWAASTPALAGLTGLATVRASAPWQTSVALTAPGAAAVLDLTAVAADGTSSTSTLRVDAGTTRLVTVPAGAAAWLRVVAGTGEVVAARQVTYAGARGTLISLAPLRSAVVDERPVALDALR